MPGPPTKIMLIRHGEKPGKKKDRPPDAVNLDGVAGENSLIVQGWQRAGGLVALLAPQSGSFQNPALAQPSSIYASGTVTSKSLRPQETVAPLAKKLGITPNTNYNPSKEAGAPASVPHEREMVENVLQQPGVVLICWQHELIPHIVSHIPLTQGTAYPKTWCPDRFDLVWVFDLNAASQAGSPQYDFTQVPQNLLAGDLNEPMQDPYPAKSNAT